MIKRKAKRIRHARLEIRVNRKNRRSYSTDGFGKSMPPEHELVMIYFSQKGHLSETTAFLNECEKRDWKTSSGSPIRNWKAYAAEWIYNRSVEEKLKLKRSPFYDAGI